MTSALAAFASPANLSIHSARSGKWSDAATWAEHRVPKAGDAVSIATGHTVLYDVNSAEQIRMVHIAGALTFSRAKSTRLDVGLIRIEAGENATEEGFDCDAHLPSPATAAAVTTMPALEIGTGDNPIPAAVTATIRLVYFDGMDKEKLPAIVNCAGRWDVHGAPMNRTWVKLGAPVKPKDQVITLAEQVSGWKVGDRIIVTASKLHEPDRTFRQTAMKHDTVGTEERIITKIDGTTLTLDKPLEHEHAGAGDYRSEIANLSRNVVIESANPDGVRGHTMFHRGSSGSISYAEFRHLGKEGVLGKYAIHFHLVGDTMRGSSVVGASIWDSHNRWLTIHGTNFLLVRDCVGYQSVGHGFFLENGTEEYNVLDRNLAVQAYNARPLPRQALPFDSNDGAGFWWANGRNSFTRNVACENDVYGYRFQMEQTSNFDPVLAVRAPDGSTTPRDVRTIPFLQFADNETHSDGLYGFRFGDDERGMARGDRRHPFIARNLKAWETHYIVRPSIQFFLLDGLDVGSGVYGVYHPEYDAQVYRHIHLRFVNGEPINRGHDDESFQNGSFTYDDLTLEDCHVGRDPLIQMACTSPTPGQAGHFRNLKIINSESRNANVVDLGGGPRNDTLQNGVTYYIHTPSGPTKKIVSVKFPAMMKDADYKSIPGFTGPDVRAADVTGVVFPTLLDPTDDLPPATVVTSVHRVGANFLVAGIAMDNDTVAAVTVNGRAAKISANHDGVADWEITLAPPRDGHLTAQATDQAGNVESSPHTLRLPGK